MWPMSILSQHNSRTVDSGLASQYRMPFSAALSPVAANGGLHGIPTNLSPDLLHALASMEEGDEIVLADSYFPVSDICTEYGPKEVTTTGAGIPELLSSILKLLPIGNNPSILEALSSGRWTRSSSFYMMYSFENDGKPHLSNMVFRQYEAVLRESGLFEQSIAKLSRDDFYGKARAAYAIVTTKDTFHGGLIIKKGKQATTEARSAHSIYGTWF